MIFRKYYYYLASIYNLLFGIREWFLVIRIFLGIASRRVYTIHLRNADVEFLVRSPMDIWSIKETFIDRFYERYGTSLEDGWRIIDIGAGIGEFTLFSAIDYPNSFVYAFEPFPQSFKFLQENIRLNNTVNVELFSEAIGAVTGSLTLDITGSEPLQTRSVDDAESSLLNDRLIVQSLSLSDVFDQLSIEKCDLLKIDCEGAEYQVLFNAPENVLNRVQRITMEYHDNIEDYQHDELVEYLTNIGFNVRIYPNQVHAYLGYLYAYR